MTKTHMSDSTDIETYLTRMFKLIKEQRELIDRQAELTAKILCTPIKSGEGKEKKDEKI